MLRSTYSLPVGHTLTATIFDGSGYVRRLDDSTVGGRLTNAASAVYGPYLAPHVFEVQGDVNVAIAEVDILGNVPTTDQATLLDNIPETDPADDGVSVWNDSGALKTSGAST